MRIICDSTLSSGTIKEIKDLRSFLKYPPTCNIYQYEVTWREKEKLKGECYNPSDSLNKKFSKYFGNLKKGDYVIIQITKSSCKPTIGDAYKFKIE